MPAKRIMFVAAFIALACVPAAMASQRDDDQPGMSSGDKVHYEPATQVPVPPEVLAQYPDAVILPIQSDSCQGSRRDDEESDHQENCQGNDENSAPQPTRRLAARLKTRCFQVDPSYDAAALPFSHGWTIPSVHEREWAHFKGCSTWAKGKGQSNAVMAYADLSWHGQDCNLFIACAGEAGPFAWAGCNYPTCTTINSPQFAWSNCGPPSASGPCNSLGYEIDGYFDFLFKGAPVRDTVKIIGQLYANGTAWAIAVVNNNQYCVCLLRR